MIAADRLIGKAQDYEVLAASHSEREALVGVRAKSAAGGKGPSRGAWLRLPEDVDLENHSPENARQSRASEHPSPAFSAVLQRFGRCGPFKWAQTRTVARIWLYQ